MPSRTDSGPPTGGRPESALIPIPDARPRPRPRADSLDARLDAISVRIENRPRILIADDTPTNRRLLGSILERDGCEILEARDGAEGLRLAQESSPDLVLLDVMMPEMDGYAVCEALQEDPATAGIPVIFLSARNDPADKIRGLELGAVDYVTKPFSRGEILARVHTHLENRLLSRSLHETNRQLLRNQRRLEEDLKAAAVIQASLIPSDTLRNRFPEVEFVWSFRPCQQIGGDVFDVQRLDPDHLGIYIVDVSGHGVPSAMITVSVSQCLNPTGGGMMKDQISDPPHYRLPGPAEVLRRLDDEFPVERFDKYFTMAYLLLNIRTGHLRYSRAAHPCPVLARADGDAELLEEGGTIIGLGGEVPYVEGETELQPGDRLFLFTDGIPEYPDPAGHRYGSARLQATLQGLGDRSIADACEGVLADVGRHAAGLPADDDITIVGMEFRGTQGRPRSRRR